MPSKASPSLIGAFVLGGVVLLIGALLLFGGSALFEDKRRWVTYFEGSVGGLAVGAPVTFRGVRVGTVTDVILELDTKNLTARIPVYFEIERSRIGWVGGKAPADASPQLAIEAGLRAQLQLQSFVTGQMQVELDLLPGTPATLVGADPSVPEVPSIKSDIETIKEKVAQLPLREVMNSANRLLTTANGLMSSPEVRESLDALTATLAELQRLTATLNAEAPPVLRDVQATLESARRTSDQADRTLQSLTGETRATLEEYRKLARSGRQATGDARTTLRAADEALRQAQATLTSLDGMLSEGTASRQDVDHLLRNLTIASRALRSFSETIERNPNALVVGR